MKITRNAPPTVVPPPTTYTLEMTEGEMLALRYLGYIGSTVAKLATTHDFRGDDIKVGTDGRPDLVASTLRSVWYETNKFIPEFRDRMGR